MTYRSWIVFGGALALAACGGAESDSNAANVGAEAPAAVNQAAANSDNGAAASITPAVAPGGAVTPDFMIGKWSAMNEDCSDTIEFRKDGTAGTPFGDGKWTLTGDKLAMDFGDGSTTKPSTINVLSQDRIEITKASGGKETQKRC